MSTQPARPGRASRLIVLCVLSVLGGSSVAMDEMASSSSSSSSSSGLAGLAGPVSHGGHFSPLIDTRDQLAGGKRAYTYRSEYKRLPLYEFGLGKRWAPSVDDKRKDFSFGLGKRTRQYAFGLGKRSSYDNGDASRINFGYVPSELYEAYAQRDALENYLQGKRGGGYDFGLGKRDAEMNGEMRLDGLHEKLPVKHSRDKYLFGLGKRFYEEAEEEDEDASSQLA